MRLIGIVGGIASGKSFVAELLSKHGAAVIDADQLAHKVLEYPEVETAAKDRWGAAILDSEGHIRRSELAKIVFGPPPDGPRELNYLEEIVHPRVRNLIHERIETLRRKGDVSAAILDVPLMLKSGWYKQCDNLIFVEAPREQRLARALARGWSQEEFARREAAQEPLDRKRELADVILDNSGSPDAMQAQVERLWPTLVGRTTTN